MPSYNRVILIGRLTRDPELRYTAGGLAVTSFSIAVDRRFKNQQGERQTDFFRCKAWRQRAEFVANYVTKGRLVAVDGSIEMNEVTGQDGQKRYFTDIICDNVETLDAPRDGADPGMGAPGAGAPGMDAASTQSAGGGSPARGVPGGDADNGYFPDDDGPIAPPPARAPQRPMQNAGAGANAGGPAAGAARGGGGGAGGNAGGAPSRGRAQPAPPAPAPAYPEDDFDDSDPFADQ